MAYFNREHTDPKEECMELIDVASSLKEGQPELEQMTAVLVVSQPLNNCSQNVTLQLLPDYSINKRAAFTAIFFFSFPEHSPAITSTLWITLYSLHCIATETF